MTSKTALIALVMWPTWVCGQSSKPLMIAGRVQDYLSQPVAGAEVVLVRLTGDGFFKPKQGRVLQTITQTDTQGRFRFTGISIPEDDLVVLARKPGLAIGWSYLEHRHHHSLVSKGEIQLILEKALDFDGFTGQLKDAEGHPVKGTRIQACPILRARGSRLILGPSSWFSTETDDRGVFRFSQLHREYPVKVLVKMPDSDIRLLYPPRKGLANDGGGYQVDGRKIALTLPETATLQGKIVERTTRKALSGIRLMLLCENERIGHWRFLEQTVESDATGSFRITGVPPGRHELRFIQPDSGSTEWVGRNTLITIPAANEDQQLLLELTKGIPLDIHTRDKETGKSLAKMNVYIAPMRRSAPDQDPGFVQRRQTDLNGSVRIFVPVGQHRVHAWGDNYQGPQDGEIVDVAPNRRDPLSLHLEPVKSLIRGVVTDDRGHPVAEAVVQIEHSRNRLVTDKEGRFSGYPNPLYTPSVVTAWDRKNNRVGFCTLSKRQRPLRIKLYPCLTLTGRICDVTGQGLPMARVSLRLIYNGRTPQSSRSIDLVSGVTDFDGRYRLDQVLPLQGAYRHYQYQISADAIGYGPSGQLFRRLGQAGDTLVAPHLQLVALEGTVTGILLDAQGQALPFQTIFAFSDTGNNSVYRSTNTDEKGRFFINRIAQGPVQLQANTPSGQSYTRLHAHSGDHIEFTVSGGEQTFRPATSRVGMPLPDLEKLEIAFDPRRIENKQALVCLVDITQRPSQCSLTFLNNIRHFLRRKGVAMVCLQVTPIDEKELNTWKKENGIHLPIEIVPGDTDALKEQWGVRSLPWPILTDRDHTIIEEGFQSGRTGSLVKDNISGF